ncbi:MAG: hypothetical protein CVU84_14815 [Firmicutes bacterium HGW-Firmicutes-1]|jgi:AraC-like DNA-binding protein|nr:MAG: hypothetical protein CVU84_14815 [Firmicutes bacterium HGW-Firmicutes-1]
MPQYFPTINKDQMRLPIYLKTIGIHYEETIVNRPQGFPSFQWIQCVFGEGLFQYDQKEYTIRSGQGLFIYPHIPHSYYALEKPWITNWVSFDGYSIKTLLEGLHMNKTGIYEVLNKPLLESRFHECFQLATSKGIYENIETSAFLFQFIVDIAKHTEPLEKVSLNNHKNKLESVLKYIEEYYSNEITIEQLAELVNVTPQYLCVLFQRIVKKRPFEYINQVRINKSKELILTNRTTSIATISKKVGFESPSYYGVQFRKMEGMTPGQFKDLFD